MLTIYLNSKSRNLLVGTFIVCVLLFFHFNPRGSASSSTIDEDYDNESKEKDENGLKVRDCRTWEHIDFELPHDKATSVDLGDNENPEHRLKSWEKDWDSQGTDHPKSGVGSSVEVTENMRKSLANIVDMLKIKLSLQTIKFLDCPSGDMTWMPVFLRTRNDVEYTGYDLIPNNIKIAKANFSKEPWTFKQFDVIKDRINDKYDLILNRHVSIHLGLLDSIQMFYNFIQSGSKYLITTTFPDVAINDDLGYSNTEVSGRRFHRLNLHLYPFYFPKPVCQCPDAPGQMNQHLAMWRIEDLDQFFQENKQRFRSFE